MDDQKNDVLLPNINDKLSVQSVQPQSSDSSAMSQPAGITSGLSASDADIIEKEWVDRAKQVVNTTLNDPFKQQNMLNDVKADYMKKRFNKDIKQAKVEE
jgi:hypothetical protein